MSDFLNPGPERDLTEFVTIARGRFIKKGLNDTDEALLDERATAVLEVAGWSGRLAAATALVVPISERHMPKAHRALDFFTRNI